LKLFRSQFPTSLGRLPSISIPDSKFLRNVNHKRYIKHLDKKYKKIIFLLEKHKAHTLDNRNKNNSHEANHSRLLINKIFGSFTKELRKDPHIQQVDISYLQMFMRQKLNVLNYPKIEFFFRYVKVEVSMSSEVVKIYFTN